MNQPNKPTDRFPLYPFLFALYPVLSLYARNAGQATLKSCIKPAIISFAATAILLFVGRLVYRSYSKTGIVVSILLVLFFSYGYAVDALIKMMGEGSRPGKYVLLVWFAAMLAVSVAAARVRRDLAALASFLRVLVVVLVAMSVAQAVRYEYGVARGPEQIWDRYVAAACSGKERLNPQEGKTRPDIYYIIVDAYSRADVLQEEFGYDNSDFIKFLEDHGFYVASESTSNYRTTCFSLPSSLNMGYIDDLVHESHLPALDLTYRRMLRNPKVVQLLRQEDYRIVQVLSDYEWVKLDQSDDLLCSGGVLSNEFDSVLRDTTLLRVLKHSSLFDTQLFSEKERKLAAPGYLAESTKLRSPKFVFAHLTTTHSPFWVDSEGRPLTPFVESLTDNGWDAFRAAYVDAVEYTNKLLKSIVRSIQEDSDREAIIVIQSDHSGLPVDHPRVPAEGEDWNMGRQILNAYYLPHNPSGTLYQTISPVNTFRIIFNEYFGGKFDLLEDRSYSHRQEHYGTHIYELTPDD